MTPAPDYIDIVIRAVLNTDGTTEYYLPIILAGTVRDGDREIWRGQSRSYFATQAMAQAMEHFNLMSVERNNRAHKNL